MISIYKFNDGVKYLNKIYTISDTQSYGTGTGGEILVPLSEFKIYLKKYNGWFAGNYFNSIEEFHTMCEDLSQFGKLFVCPLWCTRSSKHLLSMREVYSDTIYLLPTSKNHSLKTSKYCKKFSPDEIDWIDLDSGKHYLRLWWD